MVMNLEKKLSLKELGMKHGTDKATLHGFCDFYDSNLGEMRFEPIKLLEIGVYQHQSLKMWREYFPNAEIHAIDIVDYSGGYRVPGVNYHCFNVEDSVAMSDFVNRNYNWDVVVDDGGHTMKQQQFAFKYFWGVIRSSGMFIMEDLHTSFDYWAPTHNPQNDPTMYEMLESLRNKNDFISPYINLSEYRLCLSQVQSVNLWVKNSANMNNSVTSIIKKL